MHSGVNVRELLLCVRVAGMFVCETAVLLVVLLSSSAAQHLPAFGRTSYICKETDPRDAVATSDGT